MRTITATFEVVTPMFLGAADQQPDGIRPASVKGALRFWWRAWAWNGIRRQHQNELDALHVLHCEEARLFGLAAKEGSHHSTIGGQGQFMLHVRDHTKAATNTPFGDQFDNGILYLLGMGLGSFQGGNHCSRKAIPAAGGFEVKLIFRPPSASKPGASADDQTAIVSALQLFGLLGALGSRARHGMGSVQLTKLTGSGIAAWQAPQNAAQYKQQLHQLLAQGLLDDLPPLSAFSQKTRIDLSATHPNNFIRLLAQVGREQQAYRSYGRDGLVNGQAAEQNFKGDHDLILRATQGEEVRQAPQRVVFGLPHNYYFSSTKGKADVNYRPAQGEGRRASPLLLHIHRLGDEYVAVHTLLQAKFLPNNHTGQAATIEIKSRKTSHVALPESAVQWGVLHQYLDRYTNREAIYG